MKRLKLLFFLILCIPASAQIQVGGNIYGEGATDQSGYSVSLSSDGTIVAIGAPYNDGFATDAGHVRVYKLDSNSSWTQLGSDIDGESAGDQSGYSVSLSSDGTIVAIGAPYNDGFATDAGHVRVYELDSNSSWTQLGSDIDGEDGADNSGMSISLSSDGTILAIGSPNNNDFDIQSGQVRIHHYLNGTWSQLGNDIEGGSKWGYFGASVSLSDDGIIFAVGAPYQGNFGGRVYTYEYFNGNWNQLGNAILKDSLWLGGWSVSLSGNSLYVGNGATYYASGAQLLPSIGEVRIHQRAVSCGFVPIISNNGVLCSGDSIEVSVPSGAYDYAWSTGDTSSSIHINQGGTYSLIHNNQFCSDTTIFNIVEYTSPTLQSNVTGSLAFCEGDSVSISMSGASSYSWSNAVFSPYQSFTDSGAYYVLGFDSSGYCSDSLSFNITVNSNPIVTISGDSLICDGDSLKLAASGAVSYLWNTGEADSLIWADTTGNYSVTGTDNNGCTSQYSKQLLTVPNVNGTQIYGNPNVVPNSSEAYVTNQNINNSFSWQISGGAIITGQGTNSIIVLWGAGPIGNVKVVETNEFCSNSDSLTIYLSSVGLDDNSLNSTVISPNPNTGKFSISVDQNQVGSVYRIIDNLGRLIDNGIISEQNQTFDLSDKPKGVYRIQVYNENIAKTLSVVIQ